MNNLHLSVIFIGSKPQRRKPNVHSFYTSDCERRQRKELYGLEDGAASPSFLQLPL